MRLILFFLFLMTVTVSFGQVIKESILSNGWNRVSIKDLGYIDFPPTMELQNLDSRKEINSIIGAELHSLVIQPKGINDLGQMPHLKFARIILTTHFGEIGDFEKFNFDMSQYSISVLSLLNTLKKKEAEEEISKIGGKIIEWQPVVLKKVNNVSSLHYRYVRQLLDQPPVLVNCYEFHNNDRMHQLILSYRVNEEGYWKSDFENVLKSFRITVVR